MLEQAFYKQEPAVDTPYRELIIERIGDSRQVRLIGGTKWWPDPKPAPLKVIPAKTFQDAKVTYDEEFLELEAAGRSAYRPHKSRRASNPKLGYKNLTAKAPDAA
jgi:hypothetical protein